MAKIKTFKALRYTDKAGEISNLICDPYDVVNKRQQTLAGENKYNVVHLQSPNSYNPYKFSLETLKKWKNEKILSFDKNSNFYIYQDEFVIENKLRKLTGFIGLTSLSSCKNCEIFAHENILPLPKNDRFNLIKATCCNFSPIYFIYKDHENYVENILNLHINEENPLICIDNKLGLKTKLWVLSDKDVNLKIINKFKNKKLYIADGHHRYTAALEFKKYCEKNKRYKNINCNYIMSMFVSSQSKGLEILPTHRIIKNNFKLNLSEFKLKASKYFKLVKFKNFNLANIELNKIIANGEKAFILCYGFNKFILFKLKDMDVMEEILPNASYELKYLNVNILHELVLKKILEIDQEDIDRQKYISYTQNANDAISAVNKKAASCCFLLPATSINEICKIAENKEKMPQKSTYFYPKIISGLLFNDFSI